MRRGFVVGDTVRDINPNWVNYMRQGTVVSVKRNKVTWESEGELIEDTPHELELIMSNGSQSIGTAQVGDTIKIIRDWELYRYYKSIDRRRSHGTIASQSELKPTSKMKKRKKFSSFLATLKRKNPDGRIIR